MRTMGRSVLATVVLGIAAFGVWAQDAADIQLDRARIQTERQAVITAALPLTEEESLAFWPAYRDYRLDMARLGDRTVKLIEEFSRSYQALETTQADRLIRETLDIQKEKIQIREKHLRAMAKILPSNKLARFLQLENKLDAVVEYELAQVIPLAR